MSFSNPAVPAEAVERGVTMTELTPEQLRIHEADQRAWEDLQEAYDPEGALTDDRPAK